LKLTITPLRVLLFLGHLVSISLTADRVPGIPQIVAMLIGMISEGFEDAHYFFDNDHEEEHEDHDTQSLLKKQLGTEGGHHHGGEDIPTKLLKTITLPVYALAAGWDYWASKINSTPSTPIKEKTAQPRKLDWSQAWDKQRGNEKEVDIALPTDAAQYPSGEWKVEHTISLIKKHEKQHLSEVVIGADIATAKVKELQKLRGDIRNPQGKSLTEILAAAKATPEYNQHRMFAQADEKTCTQEFVEALPQRIHAVNI